ncbi:MAG: GNAT family N-acetyltransferase [Erythrobacter sp.]
MRACRDELTLNPADIENDHVALAIEGERLLRVVHLQVEDTHAELEKLFVEPDLIGRGAGRSLFEWAMARAALNEAKEFNVTADPHTEGFYESVGLSGIGEEPSGLIPDRQLTTCVMQVRRSRMPSQGLFRRVFLPRLPIRSPRSPRSAATSRKCRASDRCSTRR